MDPASGFRAETTCCSPDHWRQPPQLGWTDSYGMVFPQSPNLFWPTDHAWCVASEIDLFCTLVGGSDDLAEALPADPRLEAWPVQPDDPIALDGDQINT
jgi:hypothetical protein